MQPYKVKELPTRYKIDKDLMILLGEASEKYGQYKGILNTLEFEAELFLQLVLKSDSYKSTQIEGTQISHEDIFSLDIIEENDDSLEIKNLTKSIEYASKAIKQKGISMSLVNEMHRIILDSGRGSQKSPGKIRDTQNWIGPRGIGIEQATFIPPSPDDIIENLMNLYEYMNDTYIDLALVNVAISHAQFETIHPYNDGNGRLGRALIPIQMEYLTNDRPILYLSEIIEVNKIGYQRALMNSRRGNLESFISFFMQCIIDQCSNYIRKLEIIKSIYKEDSEKIKTIKGGSIHTVFPIMMNKVVFTKEHIKEQTNLAPSTIARIINQLLDLGILVDISRGRKKEYRYDRIYKVFIGTEIY